MRDEQVLALEARLADVADGYGDTLHKLHRTAARNDLRMERVLAHLKLEDVSDADVDSALDEG